MSCFTINAQVLNFKALEVDSGGNPTKEIFLKNVQITIKFLDSALIQLKLDYGIVMTLVEVMYCQGI